MLFGEFLKITIYDINAKKKSLCSWLYTRDNNYIREGIDPIFNNFDDFKIFVENIEPWEKKKAVKEYQDFIAKYEENSFEPIEFNFKESFEIGR